jgi:sorting nexin-8
MKDDGLLAVFLTEPSFEAWRKHSSITLEEESTSKRVDRIEEMSIPSDLEEKLAYVAFYNNFFQTCAYFRQLK